MVNQTIEHNARDLNCEMEWLLKVIYASFKLYFKNPCEYTILEDIALPVYNSSSAFAQLTRKYNFNFTERLAMALSLAPHIDSKLLDIFFCKNPNTDRNYTEFGGLKGTHHCGFLPTGETLAFVCAGDDLSKKISLLSLFAPEHPFSRDQLLYLESSADGEPLLSGALKARQEFIEMVTMGHVKKPDFNASFPAVRISTNQTWDDLVLNSSTQVQIDEILAWIEHGDTLLHEWGMGRKFRPGYRCLFYGPPGTGKTMTACLLGHATGREVYKIDLSMIISKWVGETEKNLGRVFDKAQSKGWILFFDEADALFGKRTDISSSHDRYANQEVAFLLQRIELFDGITILATNLKDNLDEAFTRRFESLVYFPQPKASERRLIWKNAFSEKVALAADIDLDTISEQYNLTGATIMNVVRYASLQTIRRNEREITLADISQGIKKEYAKEGKSV
jgi:hypothetical protein